jgi:hypothetical protein
VISQVIYFIIARTKQIKCQNKREQLSEQDPIITRTSLYVIWNKKCSVRTNQKKSLNKLLLYPEQDITLGRTTYY